MSKFVHVHVGGRWVRVEGRSRCQHCGRMVEVAWKYWATPALWTHCYCEACTAEVAGGGH